MKPPLSPMDGTDSHPDTRTQQGAGIPRALLFPLPCQRGILRRCGGSLGCHSFSEFEKIVRMIVKGQSSSLQSNRIPPSTWRAPSAEAERTKREKGPCLLVCVVIQHTLTTLYFSFSVKELSTQPIANGRERGRFWAMGSPLIRKQGREPCFFFFLWPSQG